MAEIVLGIGMSHSPILTIDGDEWHHRASADLANPKLTLADGRSVNYAGLVEIRGEPYHDVATAEVFQQIWGRAQASLDRLADEIEEVAPDVIIIVGDDQHELYAPGNIPAVAMFWGDEVVTHNYDDEMPEWWSKVAEGYGMDEPHIFPGHSKFAVELIEGLIARGVDLAICNEVKDPAKAGFGHAFGFPVERLFRGREIPIIPLMLNTYYPPNVLPASRCHSIGKLLREVIDASPTDLRVAVIGSGGLSHFVLEEGLDRLVLDNLAAGGEEALRAIPREALLEGSSEILNWVLTAGAVSHIPVKWSAYEPVARTPAGTGIGLAFVTWRK